MADTAFALTPIYDELRRELGTEPERRADATAEQAARPQTGG